MKRTAHGIEESKERKAESSGSSERNAGKAGPASEQSLIPATKKTNPRVGASTQTSLKKRRRQMNPNSIRNLRKWKPGESGNPEGRPKNDIAAKIARAIFEKNEEMIYEAFGLALRKGNPYGFDVLANRAFGKLTDKIEVTTEKELLDALMAGRKRALQKKAKNADTD